MKSINEVLASNTVPHQEKKEKSVNTILANNTVPLEKKKEQNLSSVQLPSNIVFALSITMISFSL